MDYNGWEVIYTYVEEAREKTTEMACEIFAKEYVL